MSAFVAVLKFLCMADTLSIAYILFIYLKPWCILGYALNMMNILVLFANQ